MDNKIHSVELVFTKLNVGLNITSKYSNFPNESVPITYHYVASREDELWAKAWSVPFKWCSRDGAEIGW